MYAGTTLTKHSGRLLGTHQKIDRAARANVAMLLKNPGQFPDHRQILQFEGLNGPDGIKRKSPAHNEPWHYFDPFDNADIKLFEILDDHYANLVQALKVADHVRASFEAAWLAHAIVDGLTPAHHYPYEEKLMELRGGEGLETRTTVKKKLIMPGSTRRQQASNNWKMWGAHGLFTTHYLFEWGVATVITAMRLRPVDISAEDILVVQQLPLSEWYTSYAKRVAALKLYERFAKRGWTVPLARDIRARLVPLLIQAVTLIWYRAAVEADLA